MKWTQEMQDCLANLSGQGFTAPEIAVVLRQRFGVSLTRNSIIGRMHRQLGAGHLSRDVRGRKKHKAGEPPKPPPKKLSAPKPKPIAPVIVAPPPPAPRDPGKTTLMELRSNSCRFPTGESDQVIGRYFFCGDPVADVGQPYCSDHRARCWPMYGVSKSHKKATEKAWR